MLGGSLASVCQSQSIFASASPGAPTLVDEEEAPAPRKGWKCWDTQLGWQWWQPPLSPWVRSCGGLFAATSETHPLISLSQGGLGVPGAGAERLITPVATSKHFTRDVTAIPRLLHPVAPGLQHSAWAAGGLNPAWPLISLCRCRRSPHGHACIALGFYNGKSRSDGAFSFPSLKVLDAAQVWHNIFWEALMFIFFLYLTFHLISWIIHRVVA